MNMVERPHFCVECNQQIDGGVFTPLLHRETEAHLLVVEGLVQAAVTIRDRTDWRARLARWLLFRGENQ